MNKKASLIANALILKYSFIILAFVVLGFMVLFVIISSAEYIPGSKKQPGFSVSTETIETDKIDPYTALNHYLYTKIKISNKETNLLESISLYCHNFDKESYNNIKKISGLLLPEGKGVHIGCFSQQIECKDMIRTAYIGNFLESYKSKGSLIQLGQGLFPTILLDLPSSSEENHACLLFEANKYKAEYFIDSSYSEKEFESKVKQKSLFQNPTGKNNYLISPSKELWIYSNNIWCSPIEQAGSFSDCAEGISTQELINCKGDYQLCKI